MKRADQIIPAEFGQIEETLNLGIETALGRCQTLNARDYLSTHEIVGLIGFRAGDIFWTFSSTAAFSLSR